jgi:integrase
VRAFLGSGLPHTREGVRAFLLRYAQSPASKANAIKALRRHFRDFLGQGQAVEGFKIPKTEPSMMILPSKEELKGFHDALGLKHQALFLLLASSGIRKGEALSLEAGQVDLEKQVLIPNAHAGSTKRNWYGFFNEEAKGRLEEYLASRKGGKRKLFPMWMPGFKREWARASEGSGVKVTPKVLRFWFANEMARLGVPDRFIDAFQGRIPRSVLARHYTDYSLENLKQIYDKAGLKVLG